MSTFNEGYKLEPTAAEAAEMRQVRDGLLHAMAEQLRAGAPADGADMQTLVQRYRSEFIDRYLYRSTIAILFGLSAVMAKSESDRRAYDAYGEGLAAYLAQALRVYCQNEEAKRS